MKKTVWVFLFVLLVSASVSAQDRGFASVNWSIGFPTGRTAEFLDSKVSLSGFTFDFRRYLDDDFSVGLSLGWNYWSLMTGETIWLNQGAVSGTQIRYINAFPLLVNAHYYLGGNRNELRPFLGINTGAYYMLQRLDIGVVSLDNDTWHFALSPEVGVLIPVDRGTTVTLTARFNYAADSGTTLGGSETNTYSWVSLNVGLGWGHGWY